jgi:hypothetical protein
MSRKMTFVTFALLIGFLRWGDERPIRCFVCTVLVFVRADPLT